MVEGGGLPVWVHGPVLALVWLIRALVCLIRARGGASTSASVLATALVTGTAFLTLATPRGWPPHQTGCSQFISACTITRVIITGILAIHIIFEDAWNCHFFYTGKRTASTSVEMNCLNCLENMY